MFNDTLINRINILYNTNNFEKEYHFRDYNVYGVSIQPQTNNIFKSNGYILALPKKSKHQIPQWNVFPKRNDDKIYEITKQNMDDFINTIHKYDEIGYNYMSIILDMFDS